MAPDPEKVYPSVITQSSSPQLIVEPATPIHHTADSEKKTYTSTDNSPTTSVARSDSDRDDRPLTLTATQNSRLEATRTVTRLSTRGTTFTADPSYEVDFEDDDPDNPRNWSMWYKSYVLFTVSFGTLLVVSNSTAYTAAIGDMMKEFDISDKVVPTLGITTYLFGLAVGSLILAPIAETYGRRPVYTMGLLVFAILVLPVSLVHSMDAIIVLRFFSAIFGSATIANAPGTIADMVSDEYRAVAFSIWSIGPMNGPVIGPVLGGYITQYKGWRFTNWVILIWAGVSFLLLVTVRETYSPVLLQRKAAKLRKDNDDSRYWSRYDIKVGFIELMKINLSRPFIMAVTEPICIFWNAYISLIYGILYLCFVAYPIVFTEERGWSVGMTGLSFVGIGIGSMIAIILATPIKRMIESHKLDEDGTLPPESMMSIVCIGSILVPIGQLWFSWTCYPVSIHWALPIAAGIPFGFGNCVVFIYAGNYLAYSYGIYAASAMAGNAVLRSFIGGTLPLAGPAMYAAMGPNWAGTLLGLLEVAIIPIPFLFYKYGHRIRQKSSMIREMRENELRQERKRKEAEERLRIAVMSGDETEKEEAQVYLCRVRSRVDERRDVEEHGHEILNRNQGLDKEMV
ncbi:uncharacterized protein A1O9_00568 [Exophiala aquamarina CBS 119918]|uniref:Major facilitator superfamily (MFS) profile domain-containing protein n=1 Tax=Exophiala aquamarina CBS 119918 TaxID=1182545 RepID=A0A072Q3V8_9EURO|nr:uncharacterized protein A1O9_00568 [Exophiala aquamarina CBS 119918]KEF62595.1 hypothetical protein A1O9_00568 [Exophiala aquamarina CBS 119918]